MNLLLDEVGVGDLVNTGAGASCCSDLASGLTGIGDVGILTTLIAFTDVPLGQTLGNGAGCFRTLNDDGRDETRGDRFSSLNPVSDMRLLHIGLIPTTLAVDVLVAHEGHTVVSGPPRITLS